MAADPTDCEGRPALDENNPDEGARSESILGMTLLWGFERRSADGDEESWGGGRIYDPKNGKTYKCKIELDDERFWTTSPDHERLTVRSGRP